MPEDEANSNQIALIADDDITNLMVLSKFLEKLGYDVVQAENGKEAVESFRKHSPDIIFMDVMMPEMNGYEATVQIKYLCENRFVPVIFLTALNDPEDLAKCVEAGGDDFLSKPLELTILRAKIHAIERIRKLYQQVQGLNVTLKSADEIANKVFEQAVFTENLKIDAINTWFKSSEEFNNDLFLVAHTPSNGINILFGHFNVSGLASAVGALPTSEVFRTMSKKGFAAHSIVQKINAKLYDLLPNGISLSMVFISIDENVNQALICNFNMPEVQFINQLNGEIYFQQPSKRDTIGATPRYSRDVEMGRTEINEHTRIILSSSNIFTCKNKEQRYYTKEDYIESIHNGTKNNHILNTIKQDIIQFSGSNDMNNLSIIEIPCHKSLIPSNNSLEKEIQSKKIIKPAFHTPTDTNLIEFSLHVSGNSMKTIDPIPTLLNNLETVINIEKHQEILFTILTELYINSLDHGVLKLDSGLKNSEEGFSQYYKIRENKIQELKEGYIKIKMALNLDKELNQLDISVEDSGDGFDTSILDNKNTLNNSFSGRGIKLLKSLCQDISFNEKGNKIKAIYTWNQ